MIGILSVDDHALLREGIAALVKAESGHEGWSRNGFSKMG
jgi:DNA-binding NarL/FixJ family response regulator